MHLKRNADGAPYLHSSRGQPVIKLFGRQEGRQHKSQPIMALCRHILSVPFPNVTTTTYLCSYSACAMYGRTDGHQGTLGQLIMDVAG